MANEMEDDLDYYFRLLIAQDAGLIFLCVFGAVLNGVMLYMLVSRKQIRSSVHTVYMVQIALTDLLVCIVWLVLTCLMTNHLLRHSGEPPDYVSNDTEGGDDNATDDDASPRYADALKEDASNEQYRMWRIMYSWYNFHYYTNIFLLACMSVERCAAVWKSMRCQRYQYNRKAIYIVSALMWLTALAFVMPNFVDPDMIVSDSDSAPGISRDIRPAESPSMAAWKGGDSDSALSKVFEGRTMDDNEIVVLPSGKLDKDEAFLVPGDTADPVTNDKVYHTDLEVLFECYTLLVRAMKNNRDHVTDHGSVSVHGCIMDIYDIMRAYNSDFEKEIMGESDEGPLAEPTYSSDSTFDDVEIPDNYNFGDYFPEDLPENDQPPDSPESYDPSSFYNDTSSEFFDAQNSMDSGLYRSLLSDAVRALIEHRHKMALYEACDPHLTNAARVYILTVNLVLGFFIPFAVIVFSYVSIAYMIGKRARSRMNPHMSEMSTTNIGPHYLQNPSTTNIPIAYLRERQTPRPRQTDSMGRRMSDFMKYVLLRKPQEGADNGTYWTDSDRDISLQKMPLTSSSRHLEDHSGEGQHYEVGHGASRGVLVRIRSKLGRRNTAPKRFDDTSHAANHETTHEDVKFRNNYEHNGEKVKLPLRAKKYSFCYDATNEHIPQTIAEHPHETEEDIENEEFLTESNGSFPADPSTNHRGHAALLLMQRNSRRESGGSYGSSMDSVATDQTLMTSLGHDKRYSAATTMSALTPPTPVDPGNPNANAFFPLQDDKVPYNRSQSAEPSCSHPADGKEHAGHDQRFHRPQQKPGSQLNDITLKLYRKSLQKLHHEEIDAESAQKPADNAADQPGTSNDLKEKAAAAAAKAAARSERYSYPRMNRSQSVPEERMNAIRGPRSSKSVNRIAGDAQRLSTGDNEPHAPYYPKYNRQVSSSSAVFFTRGRTFSTTSRGSVGTNTLRKTMARKNAERHLRVSRTVLAYVIVFSICWLPQRIVYLLYVSESLMGTPAPICVKLISGTRLVSFISVLLNPIVYIVTQRELRAYVRKSWLVTKLRHWYAKCFKRSTERQTPYERDSALNGLNGPSNGSSNRHEDMELQLRQDLIDKEESSGNRPASGSRSPFRVSSPTRPTPIHAKRNSGGPHEIFTQAGALTARRRDATIDEMKEEEAAAEESLEKEMERLAAMAEEEKRRLEDKQNKNWSRSPPADVITHNSGSGIKTSSSGKSESSGKGENFEEFWVRWLESGGADLLSPTSGNVSTSTPSDELDARMAELGQIVGGKPAANRNNDLGETII